MRLNSTWAELRGGNPGLRFEPVAAGALPRDHPGFFETADGVPFTSRAVASSLRLGLREPIRWVEYEPVGPAAAQVDQDRRAREAPLERLRRADLALVRRALAREGRALLTEEMHSLSDREEAELREERQLIERLLVLFRELETSGDDAVIVLV